jgi:hypothetical protein
VNEFGQGWSVRRPPNQIVLTYLAGKRQVESIRNIKGLKRAHCRRRFFLRGEQRIGKIEAKLRVRERRRENGTKIARVLAPFNADPSEYANLLSKPLTWSDRSYFIAGREGQCYTMDKPYGFDRVGTRAIKRSASCWGCFNRRPAVVFPGVRFVWS